MSDIGFDDTAYWARRLNKVKVGKEMVSRPLRGQGDPINLEVNFHHKVDWIPKSPSKKSRKRKLIYDRQMAKLQCIIATGKLGKLVAK